MENLPIFASIAMVHLLGISSPGPTFAVVMRYAAAGDRKSGLLVALGVCLATLTWASFAATGLNALIARFPTAFSAVQYAGAAYLIYLGIKLIRGFFLSSGPGYTAAAALERPAGGVRAVIAGYLTNISNPKVIAYYTSLFGVMLPAEASTGVFIGVVLTVLAVSGVWWSAVAILFSSGAIHRSFLKVRRYLDALMGGLLVAIGFRLALSR